MTLSPTVQAASAGRSCSFYSALLTLSEKLMPFLEENESNIHPTHSLHVSLPIHFQAHCIQACKLGRIIPTHQLAVISFLHLFKMEPDRPRV
eukprot:1159352-Pelagomonas_calceolata.AAC.5